MLLPRPPPVPDTGWDKLNHLLAFAGPMFAGLAARHRPGARSAIVLGATLVVWGATLEALQGLLPPRHADPADLLADAVGIGIGAAAYGVARRLLRPRSPR
jgi:VanZ family protein